MKRPAAVRPNRTEQLRQEVESLYAGGYNDVEVALYVAFGRPGWAFVLVFGAIVLGGMLGLLVIR